MVLFQVRLKRSPSRTYSLSRQAARLWQNKSKPISSNKCKPMGLMDFTNENQTKDFPKYERMSKLSMKFRWTFKPYQTKMNQNWKRKFQKNLIDQDTFLKEPITKILRPRKTKTSSQDFQRLPRKCQKY